MKITFKVKKLELLFGIDGLLLNKHEVNYENQLTVNIGNGAMEQKNYWNRKKTWSSNDLNEIIINATLLAHIYWER